MRWLFVTSNPWPMHHGTALRVFHLARELSAAGECITLLTDWLGEGAREAYQNTGVSFEVLDQCEGISTSKDIYPVRPHFAQPLKQQAKNYDVVVLFAAEMLHLAEYCSDFSLVVADVIDDPVLAAWRRLIRPSSLQWALRNIRLIWDLRRYEKRYLSYVDLFSFVTTEDADSYRRRNKQCHIYPIPNGVSLDNWQHETIGLDSPYAVFVGNYKFVPNRTAAEYLVHKIAPLVWKSNPDVRFCLVGSNPPEWLSGHPDERIVVTGFVDDVHPYVASARVVVIPMVTGTGIKNKLLEGWAASKPVVATPLACQGVPASTGRNLLIGKNEQELADAISRIWQDDDLALRLAKAGYRTVADDFAWSQMAERLRGYVAGLSTSKGRK